VSQEQKKKISYSELKIWNDCSHKHKLVYIDKLKGFVGNEYTAFGSACHTTNEKLVIDENIDARQEFKKNFSKELKSLPSLNNINKKLVVDMSKQADDLFEYVIPELKKYFGSYEVFKIEEPLFEKITEFATDLNFKGFVDLILKTDDGKFHIIDWKTCSWGWRLEKKNEPMTAYQLSLYKNYFANKYNVELSNIETHFALMKRTAKTNKVEIFKVTNGNRRVSNALELLNKAVTNINNKNYVKNRLSCSYCDFYRTSHCT
jgi:hypothetical protein